MPLRTLHGSDLRYHLISFDKRGVERADDPDAADGTMSKTVLEILEKEPITDVFIFSHGWMNDVPRATKSYNDWIGAITGSKQHLRAMQERPQGFSPLLIGLHWPSLPFGDHEPNAQASFGISDQGDPLAELVDEAAEAIADTPVARQALQTIFTSALQDMAPEQMPAEVVAAYEVLWAEAGLGLDGLAGAPGSEGEVFDPELLYQESLEHDTVFSGGRFSGLLTVLGLPSFWTMKKRARAIGEGDAATLLRGLQARSDATVRFHLMGHSFGCIVISATVAGGPGHGTLPRPVDTVFLGQGAVSCWAFTPEIPIAGHRPGYFSTIHDGKIAGALVTTQSVHDKAVGRAYPLATSRRNVSFSPGRAPRADGALGAFGIQGPGIDPVDRPMLPAGCEYGFEARKIYNLEGSDFIGGHCDLANPAVAHAFWSAVRVGAG